MIKFEQSKQLGINMSINKKFANRLDNILRVRGLTPDKFLLENNLQFVYKSILNNAQLEQAINFVFRVADCIEVRRSIVLQYVLEEYAEEKKFAIVPEPMLGFMRVDSEAVDLPEATILDIISATTKCMDSTKYCDADFLSLITILNALDMSPFIFFNDDSFCDIDGGEQNNLDKAVGE